MNVIKLRWPKRADARADATAGLVLGIESVPDGLASGVLAGVNPVAGLYAYMFGVASAAVFTGTAFMAVQGTGAMAIIINDAGVGSTDDPAATLVTLSLLTGIVMVACGSLGLSRLLRFVAASVMTGFIAAVGVNIALGQLTDFTGYEASGQNRILRALDTLLHPGRVDEWTLLVGACTIALIVALRATRLGSFGLVVAVGAGSLIAAAVRSAGHDVAVVGDIAQVPRSLPLPAAPALGELAVLIFPAISLAFVGLVQGAAVSKAFVNPDGTTGDTDSDFIGEGAGNLVAGVFQGTPVGGSMSASSLVTSAGARSRWALIYTAAVMAVVVVALGGVVELIAMPSLAGLLIIVGLETVKPAAIRSVSAAGVIQMTTMSVTFVLTLIISLQYAVMVGVGMSMLLYVVRQANQVETRRLVDRHDGGIEEVDPPAELPAHEVVILQPYGSLFFGAAPKLVEQLPDVTPDSRGSVVILRLRGRPDIGSTLIEALGMYAESLISVDSKLMIVSDSERILEQLSQTGLSDKVGDENLYRGETRLFRALEHARDDAVEWVDSRRGGQG